MEGQGHPKRCLIEEEYTIAVPLMRPKPAFLGLLKQTGATHEVFTTKEILQHLKGYIVSKQMFDFENPSIVHCKDDLLGEVFGVPQFTINDVLNLLAENCIQLPDTNLQRKRHLVSKPSISSSIVPTSSIVPEEQAAPQTSSSVISSTSSTKASNREINLPHTKSRKSSSSSYSGEKVDKPEYTSEKNVTSLDDSLHSIEKKCSEKQDNIGQSSHEQSVDSVVGSLPDQNRDLLDEGSVSNTKRKRKNNNSPGDATGRKRHQTEPGTIPGAGEPSRRRGTSLSITYGDDCDKDGYPWYFQVELGDRSDNEKSEVLSVQGKETVIVQDSTDDLWFLEEDSIAVEVPSDTEFSIEYDVESDVSPPTESDFGSVRSGESFLVVCKESDVEFFADCSDSESNDGDKELTEADNWVCTECNQSNPPVQRYCGRCWKLRTDWLSSQSGSEDRHIGKNNINITTEEKDKNLIESASEICDDRTISNTLTKDLEEPRYSFSNIQLKQTDNTSCMNDCGSENAKVTKAASAALEDPCIICLTRPKTASLIHGSSGHQVCCFSCGKRLRRHGKLCPVCRRPIQKVVRNYIL